MRSMAKGVKRFLKKTPPYGILCAYRDWSLVRRWIKEGCSATPPGLIKRAILLRYCREYKPAFFVETGTFLAETTKLMSKHCEVVFSIELNRALYKQARYALSRYPNVILANGDSKNELPGILEKITNPALFWLDAHYSGGITSKADEFTPIKYELSYILSHPIEGHIILIDDARLFNGTDDYPDIAEIKSMVSQYKPKYTFKVENDIIHIVP